MNQQEQHILQNGYGFMRLTCPTSEYSFQGDSTYISAGGGDSVLFKFCPVCGKQLKIGKNLKDKTKPVEIDLGD